VYTRGHGSGKNFEYGSDTGSVNNHVLPLQVGEQNALPTDLYYRPVGVLQL